MEVKQPTENNLYRYFFSCRLCLSLLQNSIVTALHLTLYKIPHRWFFYANLHCT